MYEKFSLDCSHCHDDHRCCWHCLGGATVRIRFYKYRGECSDNSCVPGNARLVPRSDHPRHACGFRSNFFTDLRRNLKMLQRCDLHGQRGLSSREPRETRLRAPSCAQVIPTAQAILLARKHHRKGSGHANEGLGCKRACRHGPRRLSATVALARSYENLENQRLLVDASF